MRISRAKHRAFILGCECRHVSEGLRQCGVPHEPAPGRPKRPVQPPGGWLRYTGAGCGSYPSVSAQMVRAQFHACAASASFAAGESPPEPATGR